MISREWWMLMVIPFVFIELRTCVGCRSGAIPQSAVVAVICAMRWAVIINLGSFSSSSGRSSSHLSQKAATRVSQCAGLTVTSRRAPALRPLARRIMQVVSGIGTESVNTDLYSFPVVSWLKLEETHPGGWLTLSTWRIMPAVSSSTSSSRVKSSSTTSRPS